MPCGTGTPTMLCVLALSQYLSLSVCPPCAVPGDSPHCRPPAPESRSPGEKSQKVFSVQVMPSASLPSAAGNVSSRLLGAVGHWGHH